VGSEAIATSPARSAGFSEPRGLSALGELSEDVGAPHSPQNFFRA
jgi:hypothetical protein